MLISINQTMGGTVPDKARFQDSDVFQKAIKMVLKCILNVILHHSGFKLLPSPTHAKVNLMLTKST